MSSLEHLLLMDHSALIAIKQFVEDFLLFTKNMHSICLSYKIDLIAQRFFITYRVSNSAFKGLSIPIIPL